MVSFRDSKANTRPKELVIYIDLPKLVSKNHLFRPLFATAHYKALLTINPLGPKSDQCQISPCDDINAL